MHRSYNNEDITIFWDSDKCRHAGKCITGSPDVFNFNKKPWVDLSQAENPAVWETVKQCPSGALDILYNHDIDVKTDAEGARSIALDAGTVIGECDYIETPDAFQIVHTEVAPAYGGKGIAKRLVYKVVEEAERKQKTVVPLCSYAAKVLS